MVTQVVDGDQVIATAVEAFGTVHILVNNAGILRDVSFHRMSPEEFDIVVQVHLYGCFAMCRAAWPVMRDQEYGRIVNITSVNGLYVIQAAAFFPRSHSDRRSRGRSNPHT